MQNKHISFPHYALLYLWNSNKKIKIIIWILNSESWFQLLTRFVSQYCNSIGICVWSAINSLGRCQLVEKYFKMSDFYKQNAPSLQYCPTFGLLALAALVFAS